MTLWVFLGIADFDIRQTPAAVGCARPCSADVPGTAHSRIGNRIVAAVVDCDRHESGPGILVVRSRTIQVTDVHCLTDLAD